METIHIDTPIGGIDGNMWEVCTKCGVEFQGGGELCKECLSEQEDREQEKADWLDSHNRDVRTF